MYFYTRTNPTRQIQGIASFLDNVVFPNANDQENADIGISCDQFKALSPAAIKKIGRDVGEFCALAYTECGLVHMGLCAQTVTKAADGKTGILGLENLVGVQALMNDGQKLSPVERMFVPLFQNPAFPIGEEAVKAFNKLTGQKIRAGGLEVIAQARSTHASAARQNGDKARVIRLPVGKQEGAQVAVCG